VSESGLLLRPVHPPREHVSFTVVVLVPSYEFSIIRTIASLANVHYDLKIVFVCFDPDMYEHLSNQLTQYKFVLPPFAIFAPKRKLTIREGVTAGLQDVKSEFVCLMLAGDMLHMCTFERLAAAVNERSAFCYTSRQLFVNSYGWALNQDRRKSVWRFDYLVQHADFLRQPVDIHDFEQDIQIRVPKEQQFDLDDVLFFECVGLPEEPDEKESWARH
jgi:hypothetical protein